MAAIVAAATSASALQGVVEVEQEGKVHAYKLTANTYDNKQWWVVQCVLHSSIHHVVYVGILYTCMRP